MQIVKKANVNTNKNIDPCYLNACKFIEKFTQNLNEYLYKYQAIAVDGPNEEQCDCETGQCTFYNRFNRRKQKGSVFNKDFTKFEYTRLLSKEESHVQDMHADFGSNSKMILFFF